MPDDTSFRLDWTLTVEHPDPATLEQALAPETQGFAQLSTETGTLIATGTGSAGRSLRTLDDLLACLTAAAESLDLDDEPE